MTSNIITHSEDYEIFDMLAKSSEPRPKGWVQVFLDHKKKVFEGGNLIVAQGREFVAQKIFNTYSTESGTRTNLTGYTISGFAVGSGGATIDAGEVTLAGPAVGDTGLYESIGLGNSDYLEEPANNEDATESPIVHTYDDCVKPITDDSGSVYLQAVSYEGTSDWYTTMKCTCELPAGEPSQIGAGESVQINEAGLYIVSGTTAKMFSHICFPPKFKEKESAITIIWYILC